MKITIDLSDVWTDDEEQDVAAAIKERITNEAAHAVRESIKGDVQKNIDALVVPMISKEIPDLIRDAVSDFMNTQKVNVGSSYDKKLITIREYIQEKYVDSYKINHSFESAIAQQVKSAFTDVKQSCEKMVEYMKKDCDAFVKELRARYDIAFASQVVLRMREEGLLRDDAMAKLLEPPAEN